MTNDSLLSADRHIIGQGLLPMQARNPNPYTRSHHPVRIKFIVSIVFSLLCISFAHAEPVSYSFTNNSSFNLGGTDYTGGLTLSLYGDTDNVGTSSDFFSNLPGSQFITNRYGVGVLSQGDRVLASITDPVQFVLDTSDYQGYLVDGLTGDIFLSAYTGVYDVLSSNFAAPPSSSIPFSPFDTSAGQFNLTSYGSNTQFSASVVPEPATLLFFGTGTLGLIRVVRRRALS